MLVISGRARTDQDTDGRVRQLGNKELNVINLVKPITKYAVKITDPTMVRYHLRKLFHLATQGRPGPVWVDLPIDIQGMVVDEEELKRFDPKELSPVPRHQAASFTGKFRGCLIFQAIVTSGHFGRKRNPPCEGDQGIFGTG